VEAKPLTRFEASMGPEDLTPLDGLRTGPSHVRVAQALGCRVALGDRAFDRFLPRALCAVSEQHWTPLVTAVRAAEWFDELGIRTVVDIGSGAGKFCVATALAGGSRFIGMEQRPGLVEAARALAALFGVSSRVEFVQGTFPDATPPPADAYYLYNPFGENLFRYGGRLGEDVELGPVRHERDVGAMERFLEGAPTGTHVLTYNGFGGSLPPSYTEVRVDRELPNVLRLLRKTR